MTKHNKLNLHTKLSVHSQVSFSKGKFVPLQNLSLKSIELSYCYLTHKSTMTENKKHLQVKLLTHDKKMGFMTKIDNDLEKKEKT